MALPWFQIVLFIGSTILSYLLRPPSQTPGKIDPPEPAGLSDFNIPTASAGREIPVVFGTRWVKGPNVVWYGDLRTEAITEVSGDASGKKKK
jgi:hypothetical protein